MKSSYKYKKKRCLYSERFPRQSRCLPLPASGTIAESICNQEDIDIILIFSKEVRQSVHIAHTRVFAPKFGYLEDPATGSGNSALGYYMLKNELWDGSDCCVEQGGNDRVFNDITLSYLDGSILFSGSATVRIDGVYYV